MDRLIYTALSGLRSNMAAQDVTAHNIANASSTGFRRDVGATQSRAIVGQSFDSRIQAAEAVVAASLEQGPVTQTGRGLDVALQGTALLAVQAPDGGEAYTRRGDLRVSASGLLETGDGRAVIGDGGAITLPPAARVEIGSDGTVSIQPPGGAPGEMIIVGRIKMVTAEPAQLRKGLDGLLRLTEGGAADRDDAARLTPGSLEGSNVNMMAAMVDMIEQARAYEVQVQLITAARDIDQSGASLLRLDS